MKKPRPCPQGSTRKFPESNWKMLERIRALGLYPTPGGHPSPGHVCHPRVPPVSQDVPWGSSSSVPSSLPEDPTCCCGCCCCLQGKQDCEFRICNPNAEPRPTGLQLPRRRWVRGQRRAPRSSKSESQLLKPKNKQLKRPWGGREGGAEVCTGSVWCCQARCH